MYNELSKSESVVQKYGGTSVGDPQRIRAVAARVTRYKSAGWNRIAVVVSAMAGETNRLVGLMREVNPTGNHRTKAYDMAVSAGEQVSVGLMAEALEAHGVASEPLLAYQLQILTDEKHGQAKIHSIRTDFIENAWKNGRIPVVAGFQGITSAMEITTLGRGGSDTSAVALAAALKAGFCEINTDVDGVYTADPRYVKSARLIEELDYETTLELAALGGKVLHSRCVELAAKHRVPLVVRNTFGPDEARRTRIMSFGEDKALEAPVVSGITLDEDVAKITVRQLPAGNAAIKSIFSEVAHKEINVDIIVHDHQEDGTVNRVGFTVQKHDLEPAVKAVESLRSQAQFESLQVATQTNLAKVSAVGLGMRSHAGVALTIFDALAKNEVEILMISTSEIKVSCVVPLAQGKKAAQVLHGVFFESAK